MQQLAGAASLSHSATTRLVTRLEGRGLLSRYLCDDDRRGIYSTLTTDGKELQEQARPVYDRALSEALDGARADPELAPLVDALHALPHP
jgi:DNA-binding MarR family transcriptional regulator